ncbi:MAG: TSUP family transporter, partial [Bacteroidota bacterium]
MGFNELLADYGFFTMALIVVFAFIAGFIDAIVGGGGLIQLPVLLILFPNTALPFLFGTNKIAALAGTSIATYKYARQIKFDFRLLLTIATCCFVSSFFG